MTAEQNLEKDQAQKPTSWWRSQRDNIQVIVIALAIAVILRVFVAEPRYIPSGSMIPTLLVNDRIIVDKVSYLFNQPQRGEIIVFYPPESPAIEDTSQPFIKRIIGLPGDRITIDNGKVFVNDRPLTEEYIAAPPKYKVQALTVPPHTYWVMGDNRNFSNDSHVWGFLPEQNIIGRASFRFWPFDRRFGWLTPPQY
jgi:signal peptidase I